MADRARPKIERIHGTPEQWLLEFLTVHSDAYKGRVTGICVHLEVTCEDDPTDHQVICWKDWKSRSGLIGHLTVTVQQLSAELAE